MAVLATDPDYNEAAAGVPRAKLLEDALKLLRFTLRSHLAGPGTAFDGECWGHSWISGLCIERMMHGIEALEDHLSDDDRSLIHAMLVSESDWLLDNYDVVAAIDGCSGKNKPESNIWNGSILHRTAMMYPQEARAAEYRRKGTKFLLNGISVPGDAESAVEFEGQALADWHVGPNFTETYALHHHGYLNVGYMVICLSNIAMLHFSFRKRGLTPPEALYHHVPELWALIKKCTFPDGRLWRIGGDTRMRYCYCQDYAIPMWLLMQDKYGETDCSTFEKGWLETVQREQKNNGDHSFMSERLNDLEKVSPLYFHRLEGDKAVTLSMGAYWRRVYDEFKESPAASEQPSVCGNWNDEFHGALLERGTNRLASWTWESCQRPIGMCLPADGADLGEWRWNLVGEIKGCGGRNFSEDLAHKQWSFPGGFCTCGQVKWNSCQHTAEGQADEVTAIEDIAFTALPDDATVVVMQRAKTVNRTYLQTVKGLLCNIPNDIFNGKQRTYRTETGELLLEGCHEQAEVLNLNGDWVNVDNRLNIEKIYGGDELAIRRPGQRQITMFKGSDAAGERAGGSLYCDEICSPCITERRPYEADTLLFDSGFAIRVGPTSEQSLTPLPAQALETGNGELKALSVTDINGKSYLIAANFGTSAQSLTVSLNKGQALTALNGDETAITVQEGGARLALPAAEMRVFRLA
jgi:hypothetical protein